MAGLERQNQTVRADRLVAILLLLQSKGHVTAAEVAAELEVSERTARRDLDALGMAGLPIYSRQGRNGGWQLIGGGRTDLSGLTAAEARALFLVAGPSSSATPEVKAALRKLTRALPEKFRPDAEAAATAMIIDPVGWDNVAAPRGARAPRRRAARRDRGPAAGARLRRARPGQLDTSRPSARPRDQRHRRGTSSPTPTPACARSASTA